MSWTYIIQSGEVRHNGEHMGTGYAGIGDGLNNPNYQSVVNVGPIPEGMYSISPPFTHPLCGPVVMRLEPLPGTEVYGRTGFLIHGDTTSMDHTASHGCIVLNRNLRQVIALSEDHRLEVIAVE